MVEAGCQVVFEALEGARIEGPKRIPEPQHGLLAVGQRGRLPHLSEVGLWTYVNKMDTRN
jgi:hypothetical protein